MKKALIFCMCLCLSTLVFAAANQPFLKLESRIVNYFEDDNIARIFNMGFDNLPTDTMNDFNIDWDEYEKEQDIHLKEVSSASILIYSHDYDGKLDYPKGFLKRIKKDGWKILDKDRDNEDENHTVLLHQRLDNDQTYLACLILTTEKLIVLEIEGKEEDTIR